jgi:hypothetical protein
MLARTHRLVGLARLLGLPCLAALLAGAGACGSTKSTAADAAPGTYGQSAPPTKQPPPNQVGSFTIALPAITLQPGDEQTPCYLFDLTVNGPSRLVGGGHIQVGPGMHHGNITTRPKTGTGTRECPADTTAMFGGEGVDIVNGGAVLFASSTQLAGEEWQSFPPGMGFRVKDGFEIVARMHYLNATDHPITVTPTYEWFTVDEAKLVHEVAPFVWVYKEFTIPPKSTYTAKSAPCAFPKAMNLVSALPHMHKLGTKLEAQVVGGPNDGADFIASKGYDPEKGVLVDYAPALDLSQGGQGTGVTFACTWNNTFDKPITYGIGDNEMCEVFGYAYPPEATYSVIASDQVCVPTAVR